MDNFRYSIADFRSPLGSEPDCAAAVLHISNISMDTPPNAFPISTTRTLSVDVAIAAAKNEMQLGAPSPPSSSTPTIMMPAAAAEFLSRRSPVQIHTTRPPYSTIASNSGGGRSSRSPITVSPLLLAMQATESAARTDVSAALKSTTDMVPSIAAASNRTQSAAEAERYSSGRNIGPLVHVLQEAPRLIERPSEDGYHWRKYGEKQVKGGLCPRSYYKCTSPSCCVRKKVERSPRYGHITEIVYKGDHNHPKPHALRCRSMGTTTTSMNAEVLHEKQSAPADMYVMAIAKKEQSLDLDHHQHHSPSSGSTCSNDDGEDDLASKQQPPRKPENAMEAPPPLLLIQPPLRTVREPRVVVQTTSDVDILDDGYRWRKYGQKLVKGSPHPRSYYKCTNVGCTVRKHVERSPSDRRAVKTTYEGKHNHDVPAAAAATVVFRDGRHEPTSQATIILTPGGTSTMTSISGMVSLEEQLLERLVGDGTI